MGCQPHSQPKPWAPIPRDAPAVGCTNPFLGMLTPWAPTSKEAPPCRQPNQWHPPSLAPKSLNIHSWGHSPSWETKPRIPKSTTTHTWGHSPTWASTPKATQILGHPLASLPLTGTHFPTPLSTSPASPTHLDRLILGLAGSLLHPTRKPGCKHPLTSPATAFPHGITSSSSSLQS